MRHEPLFLNVNRTYVLVNETWYDTHRDLNPKIGQFFLNGHIEDILDFETYQETYPEVKKEMHPIINEKTTHGGFLRKGVDNEVKYAVNTGALPSANQSTRERSYEEE